MNKRGIQGSARTPGLYKNELDLNSEHLLNFYKVLETTTIAF